MHFVSRLRTVRHITTRNAFGCSTWPDARGQVGRGADDALLWPRAPERRRDRARVAAVPARRGDEAVPEGLTVWEADGQWRSAAGTIDHEQSKVLLLVHPDT